MESPYRRLAASIIALLTFAVIVLYPIIGPAEEYRDWSEIFADKFGDDRFSGVLYQYEIHLTVAQIVAFMDTLRMLYPHVVSEKWSLGQSHEGRDIWCFRMSDNPDIDQNRPATLFDGLHHPGEWPSMEVVVDLAEYFAQNYGSDPQITYLLNHREVYFVPIVNPDGRVYIEETGESWPKKNRRNNGDGTFGVNLNDNYPYMWGVSGVPENDSTWSSGYRGPYAGSEPETQAIIGLVNSHDFVTHQSFHTPGFITFYPWAYTADPTPDAAIYAYMGEVMTRFNGYENCPVNEYYVFSGTTIDWSYGAQDEHEKIFAFTNELSSDGLGTVDEQLLQIRNDNIWPAIYLIQVAGPFVQASDPAAIGGDSDGNLDPGETAGLSFTLTNEGVRKDATGVAIRLSSDDPYIQLHDAERTVGTITAFSSMDLSTAPFSVTLDPDCPVERAINLHITVMHQGGQLEYDLPYVVGGPVILFSDDFESGTDGWTLTGTWGLTSATSNSPTHSLTDSPGSNYTNLDSTSATIMQPITASSLAFSFWHLYQTEAWFDFIKVQVSSNGGPWTTLAVHSGSCGGWKHVTLPLDDYLGGTVKIRFRFEADWSETDDGWYIDDVLLIGSELTNLTPQPPVLISPAPGEEVSTDPLLTVANTTDQDGTESLTYGFRIYADSLCTNLVASVDDLAEGIGQTEWAAPPLTDGTYWWRAYAADSVERGLMGEKRSFVKKEVAVLIQRFEARKAESSIRLTWDIITDESLAGFNIYRKVGQGGNEELINVSGLIPEGDRSYDDWDFEAGQIYYYTLSVVRKDGSEVRSHTIELTTVPYRFALAQNYPNPFNPATTILYSIPKAAHVSLQVYDPNGHLIKTLVNKKLNAGPHETVWHGMDKNDKPVASGIYFIRLKSRNNVQTRKMILLK